MERIVEKRILEEVYMVLKDVNSDFKYNNFIYDGIFQYEKQFC